MPEFMPYYRTTDPIKARAMEWLATPTTLERVRKDLRDTIAPIAKPGAADNAAKELESMANSVFRFGKVVLRVKPGIAAEYLPLALRETLPHLPTDKATALVCFGNTCLPPTNDPQKLKAILENGVAGAAPL